eukprot:scaffold389_cov382-Prasinococcus_capsulatus_cf.AAC.20
MGARAESCVEVLSMRPHESSSLLDAPGVGRGQRSASYRSLSATQSDLQLIGSPTKRQANGSGIYQHKHR